MGKKEREADRQAKKQEKIDRRLKDEERFERERQRADFGKKGAMRAFPDSVSQSLSDVASEISDADMEREEKRERERERDS